MSFSPEVRFYDQNRQQDDVYLFDFIGIDKLVAQDIKTAFEELTGAYTTRSRRQAWRSMRKFVDHLRVAGSHNKPEKMLESFAESLSRNGLMVKTNGSHYNFIRRMVKWLAVNDFHPVWKSQAYAYFNFRREEFSVRGNSIAVADLSKIVAACKKEIGRIKENIKLRWLIEEGKINSSPFLSDGEFTSLCRLIELEREGCWSKKQVMDSGVRNSARFALRKLECHRELTTRALTPILLLLMIETAGNPVALMEIKAACVESHPTDPSMAIISWDKPRAKKEQRVTFLNKGQYSISELVNFVVRATSHLRPIVVEGDRDLLFITRLGGRSKRISVQGFHDGLQQFRDAHLLPKFTFSDIRKAVAGVVNDAFNSPHVTAKFLQHSDVSTIGLYLRAPANARRSYERVSEFQGKMLELIALDNIKERSETVFGLECTAPLGGDMISSKPGKPCLEFTKCAECKNAIVIIDEPIYVARLIRAKLHLEKMRIESFSDTDKIARFQSEYQPALDIISYRILARIPIGILTEANKILSSFPMLPRFY